MYKPKLRCFTETLISKNEISNCHYSFNSRFLPRLYHGPLKVIVIYELSCCIIMTLTLFKTFRSYVVGQIVSGRLTRSEISHGLIEKKLSGDILNKFLHETPRSPMQPVQWRHNVTMTCKKYPIQYIYRIVNDCQNSKTEASE